MNQFSGPRFAGLERTPDKIPVTAGTLCPNSVKWVQGLDRQPWQSVALLQKPDLSGLGYFRNSNHLCQLHRLVTGKKLHQL